MSALIARGLESPRCGLAPGSWTWRELRAEGGDLPMQWLRMPVVALKGSTQNIGCPNIGC